MKTEKHYSRFISGLCVITILLFTSYSSAQQLYPDTSETLINWEEYDFVGPQSKLVSAGWFRWWYLPAAAVPPTAVILLTGGEDEVITPPTINCPSDQTLSWNQTLPLPNPSSVTATSNCSDGELSTQHLGDVSNGGNGCTGDPLSIVRTYRVSDACGNQSTCTQTFTYAVDEQAPTINCPVDMTLQWGDEVPAPNINTLTVTDNCTPTEEIILTHLNDEDNAGSGCADNPKIVQRTYQAQDACGNQSTCTQTFTYTVDEQAPTINCPSDMTLQWGDEVPAPDINTLTTTDNCTPTEEIILTHLNDEDNAGSGCADNPRIVQRTYQAQDACGNQSTCIQTFTFAIDEEAPILNCPVDMTLQCSESIDTSITGTANATDNYTPETEITITFQDDLSGLTECNETGTIIRTWSATDNCGNVSTCSQMITLEDTTSPVFTDIPVDITVECIGIPPPYIVSATDNCMSDSSPTIDLEENIGSGCPYNIIRIWTATDACGNESTYSQTITVVDNTAPVITCPIDVFIFCGESIDPTITGFPLINDCNDFSISFTDDYSNQTLCTGFIIRTFIIVDACGNESQCQQNINIVDLGLLPELPGSDYRFPEGLWMIDLNQSGLTQTDWNELHKNTFDLNHVFEELSSTIEQPSSDNSYELNYIPVFSYMLSGGKYLTPNLMLRFGVEQFSGKASSNVTNGTVYPFYLESQFQGLQFIGGMRGYFGNQKLRLFVGSDISWKNLSIENSVLVLDQMYSTVSDASANNYFDLNIISGFQFPIGRDMDFEFEFRPGLNVASNFRPGDYLSKINNYKLNLNYQF